MTHEQYPPTDVHPEMPSAFVGLALGLSTAPAVGAYANGLLAIVDAASSKTLLGSWSWLVGDRIFILEPWQMLGGADVLENYNTGDCGVYLDLVGQSLARGR